MITMRVTCPHQLAVQGDQHTDTRTAHASHVAPAVSYTLPVGVQTPGPRVHPRGSAACSRIVDVAVPIHSTDDNCPSSTTRTLLPRIETQHTGDQSNQCPLTIEVVCSSRVTHAELGNSALAIHLCVTMVRGERRRPGCSLDPTIPFISTVIAMGLDYSPFE